MAINSVPTQNLQQAREYIKLVQRVVEECHKAYPETMPKSDNGIQKSAEA